MNLSWSCNIRKGVPYEKKTDPADDPGPAYDLFKRLTENLSRIELADGILMDGARKLSEEAADLLGLRLVLNMASQTEGYDYDLFFRTLARCFYRGFKTREAAMDNYASDYHPAYYIRVNYTFSQFEDFYRTYPAVQEGTGMYYLPESRESLW